MTFSIDLKGEESATRKLTSLAHLHALKPHIKALAIHLKGRIAQVPPMTDANLPGDYPKKWYIRTRGPAWALKGGGWHSRKTSKTLTKSWTIKMRDGGLTGVVGTNVKYAPFVQDLPRQAWYHTRTGWKTVQHVQDTEYNFVRRYLLAAIDRIVGGA